MRAILAILLLGLAACTDARSLEDTLTDAEKKAFGLCSAEFDAEFDLALDSLDLPNPKVETTDTAITFSWDKQVIEESGGPVLCRTDAEGSKLLEIRASSAPLK